MDAPKASIPSVSDESHRVLDLERGGGLWVSLSSYSAIATGGLEGQ